MRSRYTHTSTDPGEPTTSSSHARLRLPLKQRLTLVRILRTISRHDITNRLFPLESINRRDAQGKVARLSSKETISSAGTHLSVTIHAAHIPPHHEAHPANPMHIERPRIGALPSAIRRPEILPGNLNRARPGQAKIVLPGNGAHVAPVGSLGCNLILEHKRICLVAAVVFRRARFCVDVSNVNGNAVVRSQGPAGGVVGAALRCEACIAERRDVEGTAKNGDWRLCIVGYLHGGYRGATAHAIVAGFPVGRRPCAVMMMLVLQLNGCLAYRVPPNIS